MGNWKDDGKGHYSLRVDDHFTLSVDSWPGWRVRFWADGYPETLFCGNCRNIEEGKQKAIEALRNFVLGSVASLRAIGVQI